METVKEININVPKKAIVINKYAENGGWIYCLGLVGAVIYYFQIATTFGTYVVGFLKALVWPAYLVYHLLKFFQLS